MDEWSNPSYCLTKFDLYDPKSRKLDLVYSVSSGAEVIMASEFVDLFFKELEVMIETGKTYAFIGSSGVGKTTITNHLLNKKTAETKEIEKKDKGRHQTTSRKLYTTGNHEYTIDTPAMREQQLDNADITVMFNDIETLGEQCKFNNCAHNKELGCKVKEAIDQGELTFERLISYKKLQKEIAYQQKRSKQKERKMMKAVKTNR